MQSNIAAQQAISAKKAIDFSEINPKTQQQNQLTSKVHTIEPT
jgi:hypothetical protein